MTEMVEIPRSRPEPSHHAEPGTGRRRVLETPSKYCDELVFSDEEYESQDSASFSCSEESVVENFDESPTRNQEQRSHENEAPTNHIPEPSSAPRPDNETSTEQIDTQGGTTRSVNIGPRPRPPVGRKPLPQNDSRSSSQNHSGGWSIWGTSTYQGPLSGMQYASHYQLAREVASLRHQLSKQRVFQEDHVRRLENRYEQQILALERKLAGQQTAIDKTEEATRSILEHNRLFATSDSDIANWFRVRGRGWANWAKQFGHRDLDRLIGLNKQDTDELLETVEQFIQFDAKGELPSGVEFIRPDRLPTTLLHGMLANFICKQIFDSPWWILDATHTSDPERTLTHEGINAPLSERRAVNKIKDTSTMKDEVIELYTFLLQLQEKEAHQWRSHTIRMFSAKLLSPEDETTAVNGPQRQLNEFRTACADQLSKKFLAGPARFLLKDMVAEDASDRDHLLLDEMEMALEYSARIWSQRSCVKSLDLDAIRGMGLQKFDAKCPFLDLHSTVDADEPEECNALPLLGVIQPAVVAFGTEDGQRYEEISRTWMKARVLVAKPTNTKQEQVNEKHGE